MSGCIGRRGSKTARSKKHVSARIRTALDYRHKKPMVLHDDGLAAYENIIRRFHGRARARREAVNIALMLYDKVSKERQLGPGDPIEEILGLEK